LGLDPGLRKTGWGVIELSGSQLSHVANGTVSTTNSLSLAERLLQLHHGIDEIVRGFEPDEAAVEQTFVNKDPAGTLKLGQARAISLLVPCQRDVPVFEYAPNKVKKSVVGVGHAGKDQVQVMVKMLLPTCEITGPDAADALAVAICHAHSRGDDRLAAAILKAGG
jgi:crossover junction endodeoxyribonuclease RuvC